MVKKKVVVVVVLDNRGTSHLQVCVPLLDEVLVWDVLRTEAELRLEALKVLWQRERAEQVDLTVREARLDPLLQKLQHILKHRMQEKKRPHPHVPQKNGIMSKKKKK